MIPRFRAWDKIHKTMYKTDDVNAIIFDGKDVCVQTVYFEDGLPVSRDVEYCDFDDIVLMQSTGFRDKNGKEIFEGDIVDSEGGFTTGVVEFRSDLGMFVSTLIKYNNFERLCNAHGLVKVIGNIYENPELLEVN